MLTNMLFAVLSGTNPVLQRSKVTVNRVLPEMTPEQKAAIAAKAHRDQVVIDVLAFIGILAFILLCIFASKIQKRYDEKKARIYAKAHADEQRKLIKDIDKEYSKSNQDNVEFKLNKLKDLLDKGMITQEEYDSNRKKIIESF